MTAMRQIRDFSRRIAEEFKPERIILFGSYAWGEPTEDSDVDLLVVLPHRGFSARKSAEIRLRLRPRFALDLLVRTPADIRRRASCGDTFITQVLARGKVLYEAHDS